MNSRRRISAALIGLLVLVAGTALGHRALAPSVAPQRPSVATAAAGLPVRALSQLPPQVARVWRLIQHDGPFPYRQDGVVFGNRQRSLPPRQFGFYREYTVPTPGGRGRGPCRLITGGTAELYYTGDHYVSFVAVDPRR